ncbi:hypothetical protein K458DRAFT_139749 [Lentithecium fluviatile CBS 122367]|uniref:Uncharacterized protein n=1 Tax=Lentithecium fluviatile CBS 122367 TaxID=1168545 RepID=A0A6G1IJK2_9PLEO|nr:hypothetical protein K458DRAFT_139749 [Lentithecium fluviatile CBS 122367]
MSANEAAWPVAGTCAARGQTVAPDRARHRPNTTNIFLRSKKHVVVLCISATDIAAFVPRLFIAFVSLRSAPLRESRRDLLPAVPALAGPGLPAACCGDRSGSAGSLPAQMHSSKRVSPRLDLGRRGAACQFFAMAILGGAVGPWTVRMGRLAEAGALRCGGVIVM